MNSKLRVHSRWLVLTGSVCLLVFAWLANQAARFPKALAQSGSSVFGVEMNPVGATGGLYLIASPQTYTDWVRGVEILWSDVEPNPGVRNWSALDGTVQELQNATDNGLTPIVVVRSVPTWAQVAGGSSCGPIDANYFDEFAAFMYDLISDDLSPVKVFNVTYWEIWNEPDIGPELVAPDNSWGGCWGDKDDPYYGGGDYADMLSYVYPQIKAANSLAQVLVGGLLLDCDPRIQGACPVFDPGVPTHGDIPPKFLEGILDHNGAKNGGDFFDGVSFHAYDYYYSALGHYGNSKWESAWNTTGPVSIAKAGFIRSVLAQFGYTNKFLMNTESSLLCYLCSNDSVFEDTKAYYVAQVYSVAIAESLDANVWYDVTGTWGQNNGLLKPDLSPLNAYAAYQYASSELQGASYVREIIEYPNVKGYEFSFGNYYLWLLWSLDDNDHVITLPANPIEGYNIYGEPQRLLGSRSLTVTRMPMYVELMSTSTETPTPTATDVPPTATPTDVPPTAIPTATDVPPTAIPTATDVPPTAIPTATDVPPTAIPTATDVPPTAIPTATDVPPTETLIPTATSTPTSEPPAIYLTTILKNYTGFVKGDFERGEMGWTFLDQGLPASLISSNPTGDSDIPVGSYSALLGRTDYLCNSTGVPLGYAEVRQTFTVPNVPDGTSIDLSFKYVIYSQDASTSQIYDRFEVYINSGSEPVFSDGNVDNTGLGCINWQRVPGPENVRDGQTTGWATGLIDLRQYRGQTITVSFQNHSRYDGWYNTYTYLDDVQIVIEP